MNREQLLRTKKGMLVNITCTLDEVIKHHNDITHIFCAEVPKNPYKVEMISKLYDGMYKSLSADVYEICNGLESENEKVVMVLTNLASDELCAIAPVDDDSLVYFEGDFIIEVMTEHVHYICRSTKKDLVDTLKRFNLPYQF